MCGSVQFLSQICDRAGSPNWLCPAGPDNETHVGWHVIHSCRNRLLLFHSQSPEKWKWSVRFHTGYDVQSWQYLSKTTGYWLVAGEAEIYLCHVCALCLSDSCPRSTGGCFTCSWQPIAEPKDMWSFNFRPSTAFMVWCSGSLGLVLKSRDVGIRFSGGITLHHKAAPELFWTFWWWKSWDLYQESNPCW